MLLTSKIKIGKIINLNFINNYYPQNKKNSKKNK